MATGTPVLKERLTGTSFTATSDLPRGVYENWSRPRTKRVTPGDYRFWVKAENSLGGKWSSVTDFSVE